MNPKSLCSFLISGTIALNCGAQATPAASTAVASPPNIVLIIADDMGYADAGFNGSSDIPTPNLDRIANQGVTFTNGYVTFAVCGPSRAGIMTGRYQDSFGFARTPLIAADDPQIGLSESVQTLPEMLKSADYRTMLVGKWHLGAHPIHHPNNRGFDEFYGFLGGGHHYFPEDWVFDSEENLRNEYHAYKTKLQHNTKVIHGEQEYLTDVLTREAVSFIKTNADEPFFLCLAYNAPHTPLEAPESYIERFSHITDPKRKIYAAMIAVMDEGIGRVLDQLETSGVADNTIVFFLSDNGGPTSVNGSSNAPLRGGKSSFFEGGIRVPFVMSWPARIEGGQVFDAPVISLDIAATLIANLGRPAQLQQSLDGIDLLPYLVDANLQMPERTLLWRFYDGNIQAARRGDFKLIQLPNRPPQLFNLADDIAETNNAATQYPNQYAGLKQGLNAWADSLPDPAFPGLRQVKEYWQMRTEQEKEAANNN